MKKLIFASFLTAAAMLAQSTPAAQTDTTKPAPAAKVKKHHKNKKDATSTPSTTSNSTAPVKPAPKQ
jgi:hypothetical protein